LLWREAGGLANILLRVTETTQVYGCTDLENNQRFLKALKDDARKSVKSLLIHPSNANAVMEQLRFRYGRPDQLIRSQLNSIRQLPAKGSTLWESSSHSPRM